MAFLMFPVVVVVIRQYRYQVALLVEYLVSLVPLILNASLCLEPGDQLIFLNYHILPKLPLLIDSPQRNAQAFLVFLWCKGCIFRGDPV
jgi:hypothetical protein